MELPDPSPANVPDPLDPGLRAAFRGSRAQRESVLQVVARLTGSAAPRVSLRDSPNADVGSPVMRVGAAARADAPQGRATYQLQGEIARGGMGVILKGHDQDLGRDVALKVLREDLSKRPEVVQRFVEEAQIGGQLQHPGIVPVYELGLMADQRPYFAMKLVKGRTLAALLVERKEKEGERRRLLDVFEAVCQTMAYAHSRGVLHRDLKPANILIGAFGEVQVVDWGLAKVLRSGGVHDERRSRLVRDKNVSVIATVRSGAGSAGSDSLSGSVMGTPAYMPPEQARGEVEKLDERSDVFSLGAILCEILTGAPPYVGDAAELLEAASNGRLDDALQRLDACATDRELAALAKQCLAPAQSARPRSAEVVAERIHTHLASVEERARAAQIRAAETKVRARAIAILSATGLAVVLLGGGGWVWLQEQRGARMRETDSAVTIALQDATLARGRQDWNAADAAMARARARTEGGGASDTLRARVAALATTIEQEEGTARRAAQLAADDVALLAALEDVRQPEGDRSYPTDWKRLDRSYRDIFAAHGIDVDAGKTADAAHELGLRGIPIELASALDEWAGVRRRAEDAKGAGDLASIADAIDPDPMRRELRLALAAKQLETLLRVAKGESAAALPAPTLRLLAHALVEGKDVDEAIALLLVGRRRHPQNFALVMELGRALVGARPPRAAEAVANYEAALALRPGSVEAWHELGRTLDQNLKRHAEALELFKAAVERMPGDAHLHFHLGYVLANLGRNEEAVASYRRSIELDSSTALAHHDLGVALRLLGRHEEAEASERRSIELDPSSATAHANLGRALFQMGRLEEGILSERRALELDPKLAEAHSDLGTALYRLHRYEEATECFRRVIVLDPESASGHANLGNALLNVGRYEEALANLRRAIDLDSKLAVAHRDLGAVLGRLGRTEESMASTRRAIELDPNDAQPYRNLASGYLELGDFAKAVESLGRATTLDPTDAATLENLGTALMRLDRFDEAIENYRRALLLSDYASVHANLGLALARLGRHEGAIESLRRAAELDPKNGAYVDGIARLLVPLGRIEEAIEAYRGLLRASPDHHSAHAALAWFLATAENAELRDPKSALDHARRALELSPEDANDFENLGVALYVNDKFTDARDALERAVKLGGAVGARRLFLALCHHHIGNDGEARRCFAEASAGFDALVANDPTLRRFIAEALAVFTEHQR